MPCAGAPSIAGKFGPGRDTDCVASRVHQPCVEVESTAIERAQLRRMRLLWWSRPRLIRFHSLRENPCWSASRAPSMGRSGESAAAWHCSSSLAE